MIPLIKFNNGNGAILCNQCRTIIKENLSKEEASGQTGLLYCETCKLIMAKKSKPGKGGKGC